MGSDPEIQAEDALSGIEATGFEAGDDPAEVGIDGRQPGQVDAGGIWGPFDITAEKEGLKVVIRSHDLSPGHPCCRIAVTTERSW